MVPSQVPRRRLRLERLCQLLAVLAAAWAVIAVVRAVRKPSPLELARLATAEGQWTIAVDSFLEHLVKNPADWAVRLELSVLLAQTDPSQALVELRMIPPDAAEHLEAIRQIAGICLSSERYREAKEALLGIEAADPNDWWTLLCLAEIFFRDRELRLAVHYAERSADINPEYPRSLFLVAEVYDDLNRPAEMIAPLKKILERQGENYAAHLNLCYAYSKVGPVAEARREAEWCLARNPDDVDARRLLATAARGEGKTAEALEEIQKALTIAPEDLNCRLLEGELLLLDRKSDQALKRLEPLYEKHQNVRQLATLLAQAAMAAGRAQDAEKYREQVRKLSGR